MARSIPTLKQLHQVMREARPRSCYGPRFLQKPVKITKNMMFGLDCDEVYPSIFIGDAGSAKNKDFLVALGITHVLNAAEGNSIGQVLTGSNFYDGTGITYLGFNLCDTCHTPIDKHFKSSSSFIDSAVNCGGKILVHCLMGISRSSTLVLAYLMSRKSMSAEEALRQVCSQREVRPNDGFLQQLLQLEDELNCE